MSRLGIKELPLSDLHLITRQRIGDQRGFLSRLFCADELAAAGWRKPIAQINLTHTASQGTVRGLHFQYPPHAEMKLVSCLKGEVWDVAVDLRAGSPTFLQWHAERLSPVNGNALLIPEGFAHGFQALEDNCELLYLHSQPYRPDAEGGVNVRESRLGIQWPLAIANLSGRDQSHPMLDKEFTGI